MTHEPLDHNDLIAGEVETSGINTINDFLIGATTREVVPVLPVRITSREQGLRTAAWILVMSEQLPQESEHDRPSFMEVYSAIMST
jgi:hypothetical protein